MIFITQIKFSPHEVQMIRIDLSETCANRLYEWTFHCFHSVVRLNFFALKTL